MSTPEDLSVETLADYAEGLLGEAESAAVEAMLAASPQAQADLELLTSISDILKLDDVGPMPSEYAARIDTTLAELARTEPVAAVTAPPSAGQNVAPVIDLATRRREIIGGVRRVTSVAAGLVLVIGGAAIGAAVLGDDGSGPPDGPVISALDTTQTVALSQYEGTAPPKRAVKGAAGSKIDKKTGTVYLKNGKVLHADGTVVIPGKKNKPTTVILGPGLKTSDSKSDVRVMTARAQRTADPNAKDSKAPLVGPAPSAEATKAPSEPTTEPTPTAAATANASDPYVQQTGEAYDPDNFAQLVRVLLEESGTYAPASSSTDGSEANPSPSAADVTPASQNRPASAALTAKLPMAPADRGPATIAEQERVRRCAAQLGATALAGDVGTWRGQSATVVVVANPESAAQVLGYVFYGECPKSDPVSVKDAQWIQPVDKPVAPAPAPAPTEEPATESSVTRSDEK